MSIELLSGQRLESGLQVQFAKFVNLPLSFRRSGTNASYDLNDPKYSYSCDSSNSSNLVAFSFTNKSSDKLIPHGIYETDQNAVRILNLLN